MNTQFNSKRLSALSLMLLLFSTNAFAIESPKYTVIYKDEIVEYRQYESYLVAETFVDNSASYRGASNEGFMRLFRYITGNNSSQSNIEMTAPVQQTAASEEIAMTAPVQRVETPEGWNVAFERLRPGGANRPGWAEEGLETDAAGPGRIVALLR